MITRLIFKIKLAFMVFLTKVYDDKFFMVVYDDRIYTVDRGRVTSIPLSYLYYQFYGSDN